MEAPDDAAITALLLSTGSLGNVRTTCMRAFDADEMTKVIGKIG